MLVASAFRRNNEIQPSTMGIVSLIKRLFSVRETDAAPTDRTGAFIFIVIRDATGPLERAEVYEAPIDAALRARDLGQVTGGGSQLGENRPDGTPTVAWCGIDVDLLSATKCATALELLRAELLRLEAPIGSELHYTDSGERLLDELESDGWRLRLPREALHPAFGC